MPAAEQKVEDINVKAKAAFDACIRAKKDEDTTKMEMIKAGASFKNVTRLYNQYCIDSGLVMSKEDKAVAVAAAMKGADLTSEEGFKGAIDKVIGTTKGVSEASAASLIRRAAKAAEIECWKKPKGEGKGSSGFAHSYYGWLRANPKADESAATAYIMGTDGNTETSGNVQKHLKHYLNIANLVRDIATA